MMFVFTKQINYITNKNNNTLMKTTEIKFEISEKILNSLNQSSSEFTEQSRLFTALYLFKKHKLTFGQAAELAGLPKVYFLAELEKNEIDFIDYDPGELKEELKRFS